MYPVDNVNTMFLKVFIPYVQDSIQKSCNGLLTPFASLNITLQCEKTSRDLEDCLLAETFGVCVSIFL